MLLNNPTPEPPQPGVSPLRDTDSGAVESASNAIQQGATLWDVAATLTSGMLANPSRAHFTVKDGVALLDEILGELEIYAELRRRLQGERTDSPATSSKAAGHHARQTGPPLTKSAPQRPAPQRPAPAAGAPQAASPHLAMVDPVVPVNLSSVDLAPVDPAEISVYQPPAVNDNAPR